MAGWIVSVVGITLFTSIFSLIMPNGKTSKIIKCIFSLMCILVFIKPVLSYSFDSLFNFESLENKISLDENYLSYIKDKNQENIKTKINKIAVENGLEIEDIYFYYDETEQNVNKVIIKLKKQVIENENEHINSIEKTKEQVENYLKLNKENVVIYE